MDALENHAIVEPVERNDALVSHEVPSHSSDRLPKELLQSILIESLRARKHERLHRIVMRMVILAEKTGLDLKNALEREAANIKQLGDRRIARNSLA